MSKKCWKIVADFKTFTGKPMLNRPLGRPKHKWKCNFTMDLKEICINVMGFMEVVQERDRTEALNLYIP